MLKIFISYLFFLASTVTTLYRIKTKLKGSQKDFMVSTKHDFSPPNQKSESTKSFDLTQSNNGIIKLNRKSSI